jgi:RNA polymerase sigma-70 factor (ECF subfamily)
MNSDEQLLSQIAAGDSRAFGDFYDRYSAAALGLLSRLLGQRAEAEDVLQEVFLQVWRGARLFNHERASPKAWLFLIVRSRAIDRLRRRRREEIDLKREPVAGFDSTRELDHNESAEHLRKALEQLPEAQRSAICLAFYGGRTYEAVAREQQVPVGTIKTRIRKGMGRLRDILSTILEVGES